MNKVLLIGRLVRDPDSSTTNSGIQYTRFTMAINREFSEDQTDFVPVVAWRQQADFVSKYITKGSLVSIEGRFTSSTYKSLDGNTITRYEVTSDRVHALETKAQREARANTQTISIPSTFKKPVEKVENITFEKKDVDSSETADVPWDLDL